MSNPLPYAMQSTMSDKITGIIGKSLIPFQPNSTVGPSSVLAILAQMTEPAEEIPEDQLFSLMASKTNNWGWFMDPSPVVMEVAFPVFLSESTTLMS
jgi:hypothetical protein